tara:strand:+ start:177 stop:878 length:702 start_codon:yes stop_codon:yes gene_type:complete
MIASIYKITAPNGKSYIGQNLPGVHAKLKAKPGRVSLSLKLYGLKDRMKQHCKNNSNCTLLRRSIKKYGWENMKVEVLLQCAQEQLNYYEQQMIKAWDTLAPNGLNCTTGGEAGKRLSMETRQNISKGLRQAVLEGRMVMPSFSGRKHTEETKQKMRMSQNNRQNNNGGWSLERRKKSRQDATGHVQLTKYHKFVAKTPRSWNNGKKGYLGSFDTEEEAWAALAEYKAEHVDS